MGEKSAFVTSSRDIGGCGDSGRDHNGCTGKVVMAQLNVPSVDALITLWNATGMSSEGWLGLMSQVQTRH